MKKHKISPEEVAYCSGIFDGEGCVIINWKTYRPKSLHKHIGKQRFATYINVSNIDGRIIDKLCSIFGGIPYRSWGGKNRTMYQWRLSGKNAEEAIRIMYPYLISKKEQAKLFLNFRDLVNKNSSFRPLLASEKKERNRICDDIKKIKWGTFPIPKYYEEA